VPHQQVEPAEMVLRRNRGRKYLLMAMWDQHVDGLEQNQGEDDAPCNAGYSNNQTAIRCAGCWDVVPKSEEKHGSGRSQDDGRGERDKQQEHDNRHEMPAYKRARGEVVDHIKTRFHQGKEHLTKQDGEEKSKKYCQAGGMGKRIVSFADYLSNWR
jgi:hypothetical protein